MRITVIVDRESLNLTAIGGTLPQRAPAGGEAGIQVEVSSELMREASEVAIKDTRWVSLREDALAGARLRGSEEILIADAEGRLYEGFSSAVAFIDGDGQLTVPPPAAVLASTVMDVVIHQVCPLLSLPVRIAHGTVDGITSWRAAFICSTSRLLLPIDRIIAPSIDCIEGTDGRRRLSCHTLASRDDATLAALASTLYACLLVRSTAIADLAPSALSCCSCRHGR